MRFWKEAPLPYHILFRRDSYLFCEFLSRNLPPIRGRWWRISPEPESCQQIFLAATDRVSWKCTIIKARLPCLFIKYPEPVRFKP